MIKVGSKMAKLTIIGIVMGISALFPLAGCQPNAQEYYCKQLATDKEILAAEEFYFEHFKRPHDQLSAFRSAYKPINATTCNSATSIYYEIDNQKISDIGKIESMNIKSFPLLIVNKSRGKVQLLSFEERPMSFP